MAICKDFEDIKNKGLWEVIPTEKIPEGKICVESKWVLKIKWNGKFRARLMVCAYSQVPGIDFTESYAPVINDVSLFPPKIAECSTVSLRHGLCGSTIIDISIKHRLV
jgi:hypothetical protein